MAVICCAKCLVGMSRMSVYGGQLKEGSEWLLLEYLLGEGREESRSCWISGAFFMADSFRIIGAFR